MRKPHRLRSGWGSGLRTCSSSSARAYAERRPVADPAVAQWRDPAADPAGIAARGRIFILDQTAYRGPAPRESAVPGARPTVRHCRRATPLRAGSAGGRRRRTVAGTSLRGWCGVGGPTAGAGRWRCDVGHDGRERRNDQGHRGHDDRRQHRIPVHDRPRSPGSVRAAPARARPGGTPAARASPLPGLPAAPRPRPSAPARPRLVPAGRLRPGARPSARPVARPLPATTASRRTGLPARYPAPCIPKPTRHLLPR